MNLSSFIWSVADLLRGKYKPHEYGRVILPFTVPRRMDCVLEPTKQAVKAEAEKRGHIGNQSVNPYLIRAAKASFYNTSPMDLRAIVGDQDNFDANLSAYRTVTAERPMHHEAGHIVLGGNGKQMPAPELRDTENVPLDEEVVVYFQREGLPHAPDAWIDHEKTNVVYEIPFNRHFYVYKPPRELAAIDADLKVVTDRILTMTAGLSA